jgi:hypothetical protein
MLIGHSPLLEAHDFGFVAFRIRSSLPASNATLCGDTADGFRHYRQGELVGVSFCGGQSIFSSSADFPGIVCRSSHTAPLFASAVGNGWNSDIVGA